MPPLRGSVVSLVLVACDCLGARPSTRRTEVHPGGLKDVVRLHVLHEHDDAEVTAVDLVLLLRELEALAAVALGFVLVEPGLHGLADSLEIEARVERAFRSLDLVAFALFAAECADHHGMEANAVL